MFKKFTWGHGIVVALLSFMLFILSMIFYFSRNWQNSEMVSHNYYEEELRYQEVIDAKNNAAQLKEQPTVTQTPQGISIVFPVSVRPENGKAQFELFRTDDANLDIKKEEDMGDKLGFTIPARVLSSGSYTLKLRWTKNNTPYQIDYDILWK